MASWALTREEGFGLALSIAGHLGLIAFLVMRPDTGDVVIPPERIEVTLSDDIGLVSTSPDPFEAAAPDIAPELGDVNEAVPETIEQPEPARETAAPLPRPPRPTVRSTPRPRPRETQRPAPRPRPTARPAPRPAKKTGGSRIGSDFLKGSESSQATGRSSSPRAAQIGPRVRAALSGAISRQLKPHWSAPQGVDAEQLVTILAWNLNSDGSLSGTPRVVRQLGINDANRPQAARHAEQAVRAVQLAAPFNLPSEYYDGWKRISTFRFDKRLSQ